MTSNRELQQPLLAEKSGADRSAVESSGAGGAPADISGSADAAEFRFN